MLFSVPILCFNMTAGFSGLTYVDDLFFALYEVIMTTFAIYFYLLLEQDVSFKDGEETLGYNVAELYTYKVKSHLSKKLKRYGGFIVFVWYAGALVFVVPFYAMNDCIWKHGKNGSLYPSGYGAFSCVIVVHHLMIAINTRNWTWVIVVAYIGSFLMFMPLITLLNQYAPTAVTYMDFG